MPDSTPASSAAPLSLPEEPNLDWLRKQAKRRLAELRAADPKARLADAQLDLARRHGFKSWRALKAHVDLLTVEGQLFEAARKGEAQRLASLLDRHPEGLRAKTKPYGLSLLHLAAHAGRLACVDLLLAQGLEANVLDDGDRTTPMHWAAAEGHLAVVRRLADAGGDVVGHGDDHELEVIGWATCWQECHSRVADFLVRRGAKHHIFSAIAMNLEEEVRRIVAAEPSALNRRMSRNEDHLLPLHFAVRTGRADMVALLLELGADPLGLDGSGFPPAAYATSPEVDRPLMEHLQALTATEIDSAERGHRGVRAGALDLVAALTLRDFAMAERLLRERPELLAPASRSGVLHLLAKRNDTGAVRWLLAHGADPNALWSHWDAVLTPLHLAIFGGHTEMARLLLEAGADPTIRDSKHDGDASGWASFFRRKEIVEMLGEKGVGS